MDNRPNPGFTGVAKQKLEFLIEKGGAVVGIDSGLVCFVMPGGSSGQLDQFGKVVWNSYQTPIKYNDQSSPTAADGNCGAERTK